MYKEKAEYFIIIIAFCLTFTIRYIIGEEISIKYGEIVYLFSILITLFCLYSLTKKKYHNMSIFFTLTFLLVGLLPYLHYLNYSKNKDNYSFNSEYISQNIKNYKSNLKNYKDSIFILELKSMFNKKKYNVKIDDSFVDKKQEFDEYSFVIKHILQQPKSISSQGANYAKKTDERDRLVTVVDVYKTNKKMASLQMKSNNLKEEINLYLKEKNTLNLKIKKPQQFVPFSDIWLDSVTGFVFSFIKPLSKISQIIRLFQLFTAYFLFYMISSWLKLSKLLNITEIENL